MLEKQGRAHKWCTPMDPHIWQIRAKAGRPVRTYIQQLCENRWCNERGSGIPVLAARHDDDDDDLTLIMERKWWWLYNTNNGKKIPLHENFRWQTGEMSHEKNWTSLRKGILKIEIKFLQIAAQNNAIRTNYVKAKIRNV